MEWEEEEETEEEEEAAARSDGSAGFTAELETAELETTGGGRKGTAGMGAAEDEDLVPPAGVFGCVLDAPTPVLIAAGRADFGGRPLDEDEDEEEEARGSDMVEDGVSNGWWSIRVC